MNSKQIEEINRIRLASWREKLVDLHSTPVLLLGVGHDHKSGDLCIVTLEDINNKAMIGFLEFLLRQLKFQEE